MRNFLLLLVLALSLPVTTSAQGPGGDRGDRGGDRGGDREDRGGWGGRGRDRGGDRGGRDGDDRGGDDRGGRDRGGDRGGDDRRRSFDPTEMLKRMDQNGNGVLDENEVSERASGFLERMKERAGYTDKGPINIEKLSAAMKKQSEGGQPETVPGFGEETGLEAAKGFDAPPPYTGLALENKFDQKTIDSVNKMLASYDKDKNGFLDDYEWPGARWRTPPEGSDLNKDGKLDRLELAKRVAGFSGNRDEEKSEGGGDRRGSGDQGDIQKNAKSMMYQYDKDKSGYLEKEEWFKSDLGNYDKNRDGKISTDELASRISSFASKSSFASSRSEGQKVDTYRFLSPLERLPKGLPDWFNSNDADEDGQIHMSEYSAAWSDSKAAEFARYDLNGDGFITAKEALGGGSSTASTRSTSSASTASSSTASAAPSERSSGSSDRGDRPRGFGGGYGGSFRSR